MNLSNKAGIYKITNKINNKTYIGQSVDVQKRINSHIWNALNPQKSKDGNSVIYKAIRKYGVQNFTFQMIEECEVENLNQRQKFWILEYNSFYNGYNATTGGDSVYEKKGKEVNCYDMDGNFIKSYPSATLAAKDVQCSRNQLYQVLYGERCSCRGYQWKYADDPKQITSYKNKQGGKIPVASYDMQGNLIQIYESATDAARQINGDASTITKVCKGKLYTHRNLKWRYYNG